MTSITSATRNYTRPFAFALLLAGSSLMFGQEAAPAADNTKVNARDQGQPATTADQQKENRSDVELTQQIRRELMKDKGLSTYAHNVKIVTENGIVTLRGPVRTDEEKKTIEAKAAEVSGKAVKSELSVVPER